jgi:hypothetical protein
MWKEGEAPSDDHETAHSVKQEGFPFLTSRRGKPSLGEYRSDFCIGAAFRWTSKKRCEALAIRLRGSLTINAGRRIAKISFAIQRSSAAVRPAPRTASRLNHLGSIVQVSLKAYLEKIIICLSCLNDLTEARFGACMKETGFVNHCRSVSDSNQWRYGPVEAPAKMGVNATYETAVEKQKARRGA